MANETPIHDLIRELLEHQRRAVCGLGSVKDPYSAQVLAELAGFAATAIVLIQRLAEAKIR